LLIPDLFEQVLGAQEGRTRPQQGLQYAELLDRQADRPALTKNGASTAVTTRSVSASFAMAWEFTCTVI